MQNNSRLYSLVDLFAGCGGLSLGFENAGFTPIFVNELNTDALSTYLINRGHKLGGSKFNELKNLHTKNAEDLNKKRLNELKNDLSDINELNFHINKSDKNSSIDVLAGGPPCQGYSGIGHRRSYLVNKQDLPSNHLFVVMSQIIKNLRPRIFLFENVRGLLNSKWIRDGNEKIWPDVLQAFQNIPGYLVKWDLVFAKDYGVPQNRPRVLLVGVREDLANSSSIIDNKSLNESAVECGFLPKPNGHQPPDLVDLLGDLIDNSIIKNLKSADYPKDNFETTEYPHKPLTDIQKKMRKIPKFLDIKKLVLTDHLYSKHKKSVIEKFELMLSNNGIIPPHLKTKKFSQRVLKSRWGNSKPNITATSLPDDYVHFSQPRTLTVREWARLQMFPDWYQFCGKRTTGGIRRAGNPLEGIFDRELPKYTQIGNAVPVSLAEAVAKHFKIILDEAF